MNQYEAKKREFDKFPKLAASFVNQLKLSFKATEDKELIILFQDAEKIKEYVLVKYIRSGKVVDSCLSKLLSLPTPNDYKKSLFNINTLIKTLELFVKFHLESFVDDKLIDRLVIKAFVIEHQREFHNHWASRLAVLKVTPANGLLKEINIDAQAMSNHLGIARVGESMDADLGNGSSNSTTDPSLPPSLDGENFQLILKETRTFFYFYLNQKMIFLTNLIHIEKSSQPFPTNQKKSFTKGNHKNTNHDKANTSKVQGGQGSSGHKTCPIKCKDKTHKSGSLFFCGTFREKSHAEKLELINKIGICRMCLQKRHIDYNGHINHKLCKLASNKCSSCDGKHNKVLCPQNVTKANLAKTTTQQQPPENSMDDGNIF